MTIRDWYGVKNMNFADNSTNKHVDELLSLMNNAISKFFHIGFRSLDDFLKTSQPELYSNTQEVLFNWLAEEGRDFFVKLAHNSYAENNELDAYLEYMNFMLETEILGIEQYPEDFVSTIIDIYIQLHAYLEELKPVIEKDKITVNTSVKGAGNLLYGYYGHKKWESNKVGSGFVAAMDTAYSKEILNNKTFYSQPESLFRGSDFLYIHTYIKF